MVLVNYCTEQLAADGASAGTGREEVKTGEAETAERGGTGPMKRK